TVSQVIQMLTSYSASIGTPMTIIDSRSGGVSTADKTAISKIAYLRFRCMNCGCSKPIDASTQAIIGSSKTTPNGKTKPNVKRSKCDTGMIMPMSAPA